MRKYRENKQFEHHLEALISQNLGRNSWPSLDHHLLDEKKIVWFGNQVSCGVGMQRIDVLFSLKKEEQYYHCPVELKSTFPSEDNIRQLKRYVDWMNQYCVPNLPGDICPILITRKIPENQVGRRKEFKFTSGKRSEYFQNLTNDLDEFDREYGCKVKLVEYYIDNSDNIIFEKIDY